MSQKLDYLPICKRCGHEMRETTDTIDGTNFYIYKCDHCFLGLEAENLDHCQ